MTADATKRELQQQRRAARKRFITARRAENGFIRALRSVAKQVDALVRGFAPQGVPEDRAGLDTALREYGRALHPWAVAVTARMQSEVDRRDVQAWEKLARSMGGSLRKEVRNTPMGAALRNALSSQVQLITSLPLEAAKRVRELTTELIFESGRADEIKEKILRSGAVTLARAKTIARTEVSRTATELTRQRASAVGSEGYFWRTSGDSDVRSTHKKLEGKFVRWDTPPVSEEDGTRAHAGQIYNCRCWPEPVLPELM